MTVTRTNFLVRLSVFGTEELAMQQGNCFSHWIRIVNPGGAAPELPRFRGKTLELCFGDVVSEADAQRCHTKAPGAHDVSAGLEFFRAGWASDQSKLVISCDYGASRSPALAYVCVADCLGSGRELEALEVLLQIRANAVPNQLVVKLGDGILGRKGALELPLRQYYARLDEEISRWRR